MRSFAASALVFALVQFPANPGLLGGAAAAGNVDAQIAVSVTRERDARGFSALRVAQNAGTETSHSATAEPDDPQSSSSTNNAADRVCRALQSAARSNELPLDYLTRLIWQESRFDAHAISRAGAQGIAQFMPGTAAWVGLADPFDPADAIAKSAELLRKLKSQFGNLGLAAAAYNAGPKRVADWLAGHNGLPRETEDYVRIVTGHAAQEWTTPIERQSLSMPDGVPCPQIAKLFADGRPETAKPTAGPEQVKLTNRPAVPEPPWGVQLIGGSSQTSVLASYHELQRKYQTVLGSRQPLVIRSPAGRNASWYRVRIAAQTLAEAEQLCGSLRSAGGSCLVQRN